jgi:hypothetical protein
MQKYRLIEGLLSSLGFACALFLFLPLVVYLLNPASVATPKITILLCGGLLALITVCILTAISLVLAIGRYVRAVCQIGLLAILVLTIIPNRTGELSGFGSSLLTGYDPLATAKLFALLGAGALLAWRKPRMLSSLSHYALIVVLLVTGYVAIGRVSVADKAAGRRSDPPESFTQLGSATNVIVVIFDCFTGYRMAEILKEHPKLREDLSGFVYYPSAIASAVNTPAGLGAILTGDLKTSIEIDDWIERNTASLENSFLADAKRLGLTTGFISHLGTKDIDIPRSREQNFFKQHPLGLFNRLPTYLGFLVLSMSRVTPSFFPSIASKGADRITRHIRKAALTDWDVLHSLQTELERHSLASKMAFGYFIDNLEVTKKTGSAIVLHSVMTHPPYNLSADGHYVPDDGKGYEGTSIYATRELVRLSNKLRALGVYDATLVIAVADHGAMKIRDKTMGRKFPASQPLPVHYNPLLMIKAPGAHGPCRDSAMSVWLGDVAATVRDFLGVSNSLPTTSNTRSLLQPEMLQRVLNVPIFFRPDQVSHHSSLAKWIRQDTKGFFENYGEISSEKPENLLRAKAKIKLFSGIDQRVMETMKQGWAKGKSIPYRGCIEVNGRLLTKLTSQGIAVVTGGKGGYQTQKFTDLAAGAEFLKKIPSDQDRLAVGLHVPASLVAQLFPEADSSSNLKTPVGFVAVAGPSYGPVPRAVVGANDASLDIDWKQ